jgi:phosphatidylinositol transfer protein SFH5
MERGVQKLNLNSATVPLADGEEDPYKVIQVHDYVSVSFFRMDPSAKAASKETINVLSTAYPELLAHKYFVNVPVIMGWMYAAMKLFVAPATLKKFHPMSSGTSLAAELPEGIRASLPNAYGGQAGTVQEIGEELKLQPAVESEPKEAVEPKVEEAKPENGTAEVQAKPAEEAKAA